MKLKYGYSFYPEHCFSWEETERDIKLIKKSGANVVRMGEFCWDQLEPREGVFELEWLEKVINILGENGISTVLCTPTACPPAWMMNTYKKLRYVDNRGVERPFGGRNHFCYNNEDYLRLAVRISEKLSEKFGKNPHVIGFQIGNEFAQEGTGRCHCDTCREKFRLYLKNRYKTIENLNRSWGTFFWSQTYGSFEDVDFPVSADESCAQMHIKGFKDNPSLRLIFHRFSSDSLTDCVNLLANALRRYSERPISTNSTGFGTNSIDYCNFYKELDVYGLDSYPPLWKNTASWLPLDYSFARNLKKQNFWILEFSVGGGHANQQNGRPQPLPGAIELFSMYSFASGAELLTHFQFKTFRFGAEQLNYSLLDQDSVPRRKYFEFQKTAAAVKKYEKLLTSTDTCRSNAAIMINYESLWSLGIKPAGGLRYLDYVTELLHAFNTEGIAADVIGTDACLEDYKLVVVPSMFVMGGDTKQKLIDFTQAGGTVLGTFLTAVKNMDNAAETVSLPAGLTELFGASVYEVEPVNEETVNTVSIEAGTKVTESKNMYWLDELETGSAQSMGKLLEGYRKGRCVLSRNKFGKGRAYYLGTGIDEKSMRKLLRQICAESGCEKIPFDLPENVEFTVRTLPDGRKVYGLFNFGAEPAEIIIGAGFENTEGKRTMERIELTSMEYEFITERLV